MHTNNTRTQCVVLNFSGSFVCMPEHTKGRNHRENLVATSAMVGRICPPGEDRVKVSENLVGTAVVPVAHVGTSLMP